MKFAKILTASILAFAASVVAVCHCPLSWPLNLTGLQAPTLVAKDGSSADVSVINRPYSCLHHF